MKNNIAKTATVKQSVTTPHEGWVQITPAIRRLATQIKITPEALARDILLSGALALDAGFALDMEIEINPIPFRYDNTVPSAVPRWTITEALDTLPLEIVSGLRERAASSGEPIQSILYADMLNSLPCS